MLHFARHKQIGFLLEDAQAGAGAETDLLAANHGAGIFDRVFEFASAGSFSQSSFFLVV
jgi:hypothetical protein